MSHHQVVTKPVTASSIRVGSGSLALQRREEDLEPGQNEGGQHDHGDDRT